jgi:glycosyltransferase involved in cell wall biosynthesis
MDQKNHTFLIDIFAEVSKIRADARLILVGEVENLEGIKEKFASLGLEDKVIFKGIIPDVERYYSAMDVFLLPSLYEGLPVVALEAQATGLPCVISDAVTTESAVISEVEFLPVNRDVEKWAKVVCEAKVDDRAECNRIFRGGKFNIENSAGQMREYYDEILSK